MDKTQLALVIGLGVALIFGYYVAQKSRGKEKIHAGVVAQVFHHIGATFIAGILPVILASLILGQGFRTAFPLAVTFLAAGWVALMVYAVIERPARLKISTADQGWTKEDARKSY
jgi:hypothetical protein